jgi:hypothetical protein
VALAGDKLSYAPARNNITLRHIVYYIEHSIMQLASQLDGWMISEGREAEGCQTHFAFNMCVFVCNFNWG